MIKKQCEKCVNDSTVKNIKFNENGLCSFCEAYQQIEEKIHDYNYLEKLFISKLHLGEGNYKYDVALGFSGGKDSTYVLYKLVKTYNLKVIAYTLDNGFLTEEAKRKIDSIVKYLNVEHEYVVYDQEILKRIYHRIVGKFLSPCLACSFLGYAAMINYASKVNARVGMHGRSIYQMLRGFDGTNNDIFAPFILNGLKKTSEEELNNFYNSLLEKIGKLVDKKLESEIKKIVLIDSLKNGYREFISYFLYHPYDKDEIINFLEKNTPWRVESEEEHFDCSIHNGALYLKDLIQKRSHLMPEYSVMIREKKLKKEEALNILEKRVPKEKAIPEIKKLARYANLNYNFLMFKAKIYSKRWW